MDGKKLHVRYCPLSDDEIDDDEGEVQGDDDEGHNIQELLICH